MSRPNQLRAYNLAVELAETVSTSLRAGQIKPATAQRALSGAAIAVGLLEGESLGRASRYLIACSRRVEQRQEVAA